MTDLRTRLRQATCDHLTHRPDLSCCAECGLTDEEHVNGARPSPHNEIVWPLIFALYKAGRKVTRRG